MRTSTPTTPTQTPLKILLMGPPGSRKTTLALQFPSVHVLDCDRNLTGPESWLRKNLDPKLSFTVDDIRVDDSGNQIDIEQCYDRIIIKLSQFKTDSEYKSRQTILLDSLSHVNEFIIRHVLRLQAKTKKTYEMEARDWSPFKSFAYNLLVGKLEESNKTVICTCHEIKIYDAPTKENIMNPNVSGYEPFFQGKVGETIGAFFTDVWRLQLEPAPGQRNDTILYTQKMPQCEVLKNSLNMPSPINITNGLSIILPYLKGRI